VGILFIEHKKTTNKSEFIESLIEQFNEIIKTFLYESADIKALLLDVDSVARGIAGAKQPFNLNNLPSRIKMRDVNVKTNVIKDETEEERLKRHEEFINSLKDVMKSQK
jgi:hypothetical protein